MDVELPLHALGDCRGQTGAAARAQVDAVGGPHVDLGARSIGQEGGEVAVGGAE